MTERPIPYTADMIIARREGVKTQTRRRMRKQPPDWAQYRLTVGPNHYFYEGPQGTPGRCWPGFGVGVPCPYGQPGDRLWMREAWRAVDAADDLPPRELNPAHRIWYEADAPHQPGAGRYRPPMFMPRWASRSLDQVIAVRPERLQDITEADALAEGIRKLPDGGYGLPNGAHYHAQDPRISYFSLFEFINGAGSVEKNEWLWVVESRVIKP